jgi:septum formation protein
MIVLASQSPRRAELLRNAGFAFRVQPAHIPEEIMPHESPSDYVQRLARYKARTVHAQLDGNDIVLGADTTVVIDGGVLEKPADKDDARRMLRKLSGRTHEVLTGVCLKGKDFEDVQVETTEVRFARLSDEEIEEYVASGEPMDKAGAYGIQGMASRFSERIDGDYFNIVGLPIPRVYRMLKDRRKSEVESRKEG